jgi:hypothetical protein
MPKFTPAHYKTGHGSFSPAADSSSGFAGLQRATNAVVLKVGEDYCPCGCGTKRGETYQSDSGRTQTFGEKNTFCMGHDARLRGKLIRAHVTGTNIVLVDEEAAEPVPAMQVAMTHDWEKYLNEAFDRYAQKQANTAQRCTIKIGRWEYPGEIISTRGENSNTEYEVAYVNKQAETKTIWTAASAVKRS